MYRLYSFINCYLSSIQQGIQTAHLVGEFINRLDDISYPEKLKDIINQWAKNDKTIVVCNGGNNKLLFDFFCLFHDFIENYPVIIFSEDAESLNNTLTGISIILPKEIWNVEYDQHWGTYVSLDDGRIYTKESKEYELIKMVKSAKLAI